MKSRLPFIIGLVAVAAAVWMFSPNHVEEPPADPAVLEQAENFSRELKIIHASDLPKVMAEATAKKRPTVLVMYASWCGVCRATIPVLQEARKPGGPLAKTEMVMLSLDTNAKKLSRYLVEAELAGTFTPYALKRGGSPEPDDVLKNMGLSFRGAIPYLAFYDKRGKLLAQHTGNLDKAQLSAYAAKLK